MKILFIGPGKGLEYMCDTVFHGLKMLYGKDIHENIDRWYMYESLSAAEKAKLYGKGFTLCGTLPADLSNKASFPQIKKMLKERYFDYVIYGSIWRNHDYFSLVRRFYPEEKIIFIDGEDGTQIHKYFLNKGIYFKRELEHKVPGVFPVGFGIPKCKIAARVGAKSRMLAEIIPGELSTYIYNREEDYYAGYSSACFAITKKKAGWDSLRHYEILANGCIPYFIDLQNCPADTLHLLPKQLILEAKRLFAQKIPTPAEIKDLAEKLLNYTREHLTTESIVKYILDTAAGIEKIGKHKFSFYPPLRLNSYCKLARCRELLGMIPRKIVIIWNSFFANENY
jgi:hypothetical protein